MCARLIRSSRERTIESNGAGGNEKERREEVEEEEWESVSTFC